MRQPGRPVPAGALRVLSRPFQRGGRGIANRRSSGALAPRRRGAAADRNPAAPRRCTVTRTVSPASLRGWAVSGGTRRARPGDGSTVGATVIRGCHCRRDPDRP